MIDDDYSDILNTLQSEPLAFSEKKKSSYKYWLVGFDKKENFSKGTAITNFIKKLLKKKLNYHIDNHYRRKKRSEEYEEPSSIEHDLPILIYKSDGPKLEGILRSAKAREILKITKYPFTSSIDYIKK